MRLEKSRGQPGLAVLSKSTLLTTGLARISIWERLTFTVGSLLLVFYATLFPFDFLPEKVSSLNDLLSRFDHQLRYLLTRWDGPANILLFIPFGCFMAGLIGKKTLPLWLQGLSVLAAGIVLSLGVEILQIFLPLRYTTFTDVATNSLGTFSGFVFYTIAGGWMDRQWLGVSFRVRQFFTGRTALVGFLLFLSIALLPGFLFKDAGSMQSWDESYPLLIGNELGGERPWSGAVQALWLANRKISDTEAVLLLQGAMAQEVLGSSLAADFPLDDTQELQDHSGNLPDLFWSQEPITATGKGVQITPERWLQTNEPVQGLAESIRQSGQFSLGLTASADNLSQNGPARIVSISSGAWQRNLTVGQEETALVLRLRTNMLGENGKNPEVRFPGIFVDQQPHTILVSYDGHSLVAYVDDLTRRRSFEMTPDSQLFWILPPVGSTEINMNPWSMAIFHGLYLLLVFTAAGWLLSGAFLSWKKPHWFTILFALMGVSTGAIFVPWFVTHPGRLDETLVWQALFSIVVVLSIGWLSLLVHRQSAQHNRRHGELA